MSSFLYIKIVMFFFLVSSVCFFFLCFFFFFKQKTAYEMLRSLVGSEMCIRDRPLQAADVLQENVPAVLFHLDAEEPTQQAASATEEVTRSVSYTHLTLPTNREV